MIFECPRNRLLKWDVGGLFHTGIRFGSKTSIFDGPVLESSTMFPITSLLAAFDSIRRNRWPQRFGQLGVAFEEGSQGMARGS